MVTRDGRLRLGCEAVLMLAWVTAATAQEPSTYRNPLPVVAGEEPVGSCADPSVVEDEGGGGWTLYCTTDPFSGEDRDQAGRLIFHLIPTFRSEDLVNWNHEVDVFSREAGGAVPPAWASDRALFWAPEAKVIDGRHYLFFGVTDVADEVSGEPGCTSDGAIGVAWAGSPLGPWTVADEPLIGPRRGPGAGCDFLWTYDPEVVEAPDGRRFIYYGSFYGGIEVRELVVAPDGPVSADPATAVPVTIPNRYEGAEVLFHEGAWWLFVSASNCCNGPLTGYGVFAGRADAPTGPFLDREGVSLLDARVGGTPVLMQNGSRWVGPGHNTVLTDRAGQWWTLYHAVEEAEPWFGDEVGFTRRPLMLDRLDWIEGWPVVAGGPSDESLPAPALEHSTVVPLRVAERPMDQPGAPIPDASDDFEEESLDEAWTWVREPPSGGVSLADGVLEVAVTDTDLHQEQDDAPVLLREAPEGDFVVEARVSLDLPPEGCCQNYVQAGLVLYGDDDDYLKLVVVSIWETRQTEFALETKAAGGGPRYGSSVVGPPGEEWTWLRLAVRRVAEGDRATAYTSRNGETWVRGATWTRAPGEMRIGLVSMGGPGNFTARFDGVRAFRLEE